jgi:hypothetical protein
MANRDFFVEQSIEGALQVGPDAKGELAFRNCHLIEARRSEMLLDQSGDQFPWSRLCVRKQTSPRPFDENGRQNSDAQAERDPS